MTDKEFVNRLHERAYQDQITGYPVGHPSRVNFRPVVPQMGSRKATLDLPCYHRFSEQERAELLTPETGS